MQELIREWDGLGVVSRFDAPTGTWIFIALHDNRLGRPTGGTRLRVYTAPEDGLLDAMRLAEGMTYKWAGLEMPMGGGKAVLAAPGQLGGEDRRGLLRRYGSLIEGLSGAFATGEDLGTTTTDMEVIGEATRYVHLFPDDAGSATDPGPFTARGVFRGIEAALEAIGEPGLDGRSVLVQGAGDVGWPLADLLADAGARLLIADLDERRLTAARDRFGAVPVPAESVYDTECDVFAPCAIGEVINAETVPRLRCRIVAGSANSQLAEPEDAMRLHERDILYAPDYVVNGGGALAFGLLAGGESDREQIYARMDVVGERLRAIFREARENGESPAVAADRRVRRTLEDGLPRA